MRYRTLIAALSTFAAFSAVAQPLDKRQSMEPVGSPFTYEALGATPSLRLNRQPQRADAPAVATTESRVGTRAPSKAASAEQSGVATAAEGRNRPAHDEKK
jgi:hypothetical protein